MATPASPNGTTFTSFGEIANFLWSVADLLRGDYRRSEYGRVILPFTWVPPFAESTYLSLSERAFPSLRRKSATKLRRSSMPKPRS